MEKYNGLYIIECGEFSSDYVIESSFKMNYSTIYKDRHVIHSNEKLIIVFDDGIVQKNIFYLGRTALGEPIVLDGDKKYLLTSDSRLPKGHPIHCFDLPFLFFRPPSAARFV